MNAPLRDESNHAAPDNGRLVTEEAFRENLVDHLTAIPEILGQLQRLGVDADQRRKLEFFFHTDREEKALAKELAKTLDYDAQVCPAESEDSFHVITGWTNEMLMHGAALAPWSARMCQLGYAHDCEFDGWGTNLES